MTFTVFIDCSFKKQAKQNEKFFPEAKQKTAMTLNQKWVVWCNLHVLREQSKTTVATITTVPRVRPSYSHFVPDTAVQSSHRNIFSAMRNLFLSKLHGYEQDVYSKY